MSKNISNSPTVYRHLAQLGHQFAQEEQATKAARFFRLAGSKAAAAFANKEALDYYDLAISLTPAVNSQARFQLLLEQENLLGMMGKGTQQAETLANLELMANQLKADKLRVLVAIRQARHHEAQGAFDIAHTVAQLAARFAHHIQATHLEADATLIIGRIHTRQGDYELAQANLQTALSFAIRSQQKEIQAHTYRALGVLANEQKQFAEAMAYYQQASLHYEELGDKRGQAHVLSNLGHVAQMQGHLTVALQHWEQVRSLFQAIGDREGQARILINLSTVNSDTGQYDQARQYNEEARDICLEIDNKVGQCFALLNLGLIAHYQNRNKEAISYLQPVLNLAKELQSRRLQGHALSILGHVLTDLDEHVEADQQYWEAIAIWEELELPTLMAETMAGLVRLKLKEGRLDIAFDLAENVLEQISIDPQLNGAEGVIRIYLSCYEILKQMGDKRASLLLQQGKQQLNRLSDEVKDKQLNASLKENILAHRNLQTLLNTGQENGQVVSVPKRSTPL